jgi:hypothetical protein
MSGTERLQVLQRRRPRAALLGGRRIRGSSRRRDEPRSYTTGVEDADAIAVLPNTIRLRNAHRDRRSGDLHVTHEGDERESALFVARIESRSA